MSTTKHRSNNDKEMVGKRILKSFAFEWSIRNDSKFLHYLGNIDNNLISALNPNAFIVRLEAENDIFPKLENEFKKHVTGYMSVDGLIELLKDIGVSAGSLDEVRRTLSNNHLTIKWSLVKEPLGGHTARVLQERNSTEPLGSRITATPSTWDEAKAQLPRLRKWVEVKAEAGLTKRRKVGFDQEVYDLLVSHLRDQDTGLGKWATSEKGLPRNTLRHIDSGLRQELYALGNPNLPCDVQLPAGKPTGRPLGAPDSEKRAFAPRPNQKPRVPGLSRTPRTPEPSAEELREAWRIAQRGHRHSKREKT